MEEFTDEQEAEAYRRACWQMMLDKVGKHDERRSPPLDTIGRVQRHGGKSRPLVDGDPRYTFSH